MGVLFDGSDARNHSGSGQVHAERASRITPVLGRQASTGLVGTPSVPRYRCDARS
jgi:hypothetical protein